MEHELFPNEYDTNEQTDLAMEWANGYDMGYRQAEADYLLDIEDLTLEIAQLEEVIQSLIVERN